MGPAVAIPGTSVARLLISRLDSARIRRSVTTVCVLAYSILRTDWRLKMHPTAYLPLLLAYFLPLYLALDTQLPRANKQRPAAAKDVQRRQPVPEVAPDLADDTTRARPQEHGVGMEDSVDYVRKSAASSPATVSHGNLKVQGNSEPIVSDSQRSGVSQRSSTIPVSSKTHRSTVEQSSRYTDTQIAAYRGSKGTHRSDDTNTSIDTHNSDEAHKLKDTNKSNDMTRSNDSHRSGQTHVSDDIDRPSNIHKPSDIHSEHVEPESKLPTSNVASGMGSVATKMPDDAEKQGDNPLASHGALKQRTKSSSVHLSNRTNFENLEDFQSFNRGHSSRKTWKRDVTKILRKEGGGQENSSPDEKEGMGEEDEEMKENTPDFRNNYVTYYKDSKKRDVEDRHRSSLQDTMMSEHDVKPLDESATMTSYGLTDEQTDGPGRRDAVTLTLAKGFAARLKAQDETNWNQKGIVVETSSITTSSSSSSKGDNNHNNYYDDEDLTRVDLASEAIQLRSPSGHAKVGGRGGDVTSSSLHYLITSSSKSGKWREDKEREEEEQREREREKAEEEAFERRNVSSLLDALMNGYDKLLRPGFGGRPLVIKTDIEIRSMGPISEKDMIYSMDCYFRQVWTDGRLSFNASMEQVNNVSLNVKMLERIWRPDTVFINGGHAYVHTVPTLNKFFRLNQNGTILYSQRLTIKASCPMHLEKFPMDSQKCPLHITSFGYPVTDVIYEWHYGNHRAAVAASDMRLSQFDLWSMPASNRTRDFKGTRQSVLTVYFDFRRHTGYFLIQVYLPCCLLVVLSWVSFWINREATPERISLGATTMLTLTLLILDTRNDLPKVTYPTALDVYVAMCFCFILASVVQFAAVHFFTKYGTADEDFPTVLDSDDQEDEDDDDDEMESSDSHVNYNSSSNNNSSSTSAAACLKKVWRCFMSTRNTSKRFNKNVRTALGLNSVSKIDKVARIVFPLAFSGLNIVYWMSYI